jgi:hypothetical protein
MNNCEFDYCDHNGRPSQQDGAIGCLMGMVIAILILLGLLVGIGKLCEHYYEKRQQELSVQ